jgi:hypothetical protein
MMKIAPTTTAITNSTRMGCSRIELGDCRYSLRNPFATLERNGHYLSIRRKCGAAYVDFRPVVNIRVKSAHSAQRPVKIVLRQTKNRLRPSFFGHHAIRHAGSVSVSTTGCWMRARKYEVDNLVDCRVAASDPSDACRHNKRKLHA